MPRVTPTAWLKEMLFCTGPKSGSPAASIVSRCQFSLNQPRSSPCSGRSTTSSPGMGVSWTVRGRLTRSPRPVSLTGQGVLGLGGGLLRAPPVLVLAVPVDGGLQPGREIGELRGPAQLGAQPGGVDRVAQIVAGPVGDVLIVPRGAAHDLQQQLDHLLVGLLPGGPDEGGLAYLAALQDGQH